MTPEILRLVSEISYFLGRLGPLPITLPEPKLRRKNRIRTIKSTLAIEGNTFTEDQVSALLENKKVLGSKKEILEVKNAIKIYEDIDTFKFTSIQSFLFAHGQLMNGLIDSSGRYRNKNVGILKGAKVKHVAPQSKLLPELMSKLFSWMKSDKETHFLIKSCIVHYEIEFIHPFEDGNGRMGRFWQTVILNNSNPIFKYVPIESLIEKNQKNYYESLEKSDKQGDSTQFIEFMLEVILKSLQEFDSEIMGVVSTFENRLNKAQEHFHKNLFTRKLYMELFKTISSASASRDLKEASKRGLLKKIGDKNQAQYQFKE